MRALCALALLAAAVLPPGPAWAQSLRLQVDREIHATLPFTLSLQAKGFEEEPPPDPPELAIKGCEITYLGVSPSVSSGIQIINGRRTEWRDVTFVYRWRIEAPAAGSYTVPALTVSQGDKSASSRAASFTAKDIAVTQDMVVRMSLPDRPVWVGETFDVSVEWLLRRDVRDHEFVVPLFDLDQVRVESPAAPRERSLSFPAGAREIELPIRQDVITEGTTRYNRFRFPARVTVTRPGPLELEPVMVAAALEIGTRRDSFGFRVPAYELFKAEGKRRRLVVRPLPQEGRPASFENAIGRGFSIDVQASRTVVQVGDPIELQIRIRGDGPLEGLSLPRLDGPGSLPPGLFSVADAATVGVIDEQENAKTFDVTIRIRSSEAREIPSIEFSYFDPASGGYSTARSQPIALSVAGSNLVGATDVTVAPTVAGSPRGSAPDQKVTAPGRTITSLIGADMSLSAPSKTLRRVWDLEELMPVLALLYSLALAMVGARVWWMRTQWRRSRNRELGQALRAVEKAIDSETPTRDAAPLIINAMRVLALLAGREPAMRSPVLEQLETHAFDPSAADKPLDGDVANSIRALARDWARDARTLATGAGPVMTAMLCLAVTVAAWAPSAGAGGIEDTVLNARDAYQAALTEDDRARRTRLFADAEQFFRTAAAKQPDSPNLLTDWGNAAMGGQDLGRAVLAYRRALAIDPTHERAQKNLAWLRDRSPVWLPRPAEGGALDSLFFWHHNLSVAQRHLIGATAFALGLLLLAPWSERRTRLLRRLAIPFLIVWVATTGSAVLATCSASDAVVLIDGTLLRSADSLGAPPTLGNPLPAGAELSILETRDAWTRVALSDGTRGWIASSTIEAVAP